ncbi:hypothetical protein B484DRAFT_433312, partial [Ochromonadaceae sp. CCMP2298]
MPSNLKKIRDIERLMKRVGSTDELKAKLAEAKKAKGDVVIREKEKKHSTRYHMVRFMERKKLTRMVRALEGRIKREVQEQAQGGGNDKNGSAKKGKNGAKGESGQTGQGGESGEGVDLMTQRSLLLQDLAYVMYYPMKYKYVGLFPGAKGVGAVGVETGEEGDKADIVAQQRARVLALEAWARDGGGVGRTSEIG